MFARWRHLNGRHLIPARYSFSDPGRMKGWVGLVGWPSGRYSHISGHTSAADRAEVRESSPVIDGRSNHWATQPTKEVGPCLLSSMHWTLLSVCILRRLLPFLHALDNGWDRQAVETEQYSGTTHWLWLLCVNCWCCTWHKMAEERWHQLHAAVTPDIQRTAHL